MPRAMGFFLALAGALGLGCAKKEAPPAPFATTPAAAPRSAETRGSPALQFIDDDLAAASAKARAESKALFVDAWAPWCHTCLSMKRFVLADPSLRPLAARVVFAAVDTDRSQNAAFLERRKLGAWPTFFVIEPSTDAVLGYWVGAASARELREFIEGSLEKQGLGGDPAGRAFAEAHAAHAAGDFEKAAAGYQRALEASPAGWSRRSAALLGWMEALAGAKQAAACARLGRAHLSEIRAPRRRRTSARSSSRARASCRTGPSGPRRARRPSRGCES